MNNIEDYKYYKYSFPTIRSTIINFINALVSNINAIKYFVAVMFVLGFIIHKFIYDLSGFKYWLLVLVSVCVIAIIIFIIIYIFTKKGVYIYDDNQIVMKNGFFASSNYYNFSRFKYSFYTWQIKNIEILSLSKKYSAW